MYELTGKKALVTGAGSGIGEEIAHVLARAGAQVYVTDVTASQAAAVAAAIVAAGGQAQHIQMDVTQAASCEAAHDITGCLDILVNNAGIGLVGTLLTTSQADMERLCQVNLMGVFVVCKTFVPDMLAAGRGSVINISSIGGVVGIVDRLAYCTTKFAVTGMTKCMALDHAKQGVRFNAICPGRVETPFVQQMIRQYPDPEAAYRNMAATQPMGRMASTAEVASVALFLASDASAFITGDTLMVDGGWSAG
ncbi:MAG: glucose 1-dehydrogenase [Bacteroidia bacterium]|nr:glucose 1-dehydrogenase [Bacteroidia bacterium]